MGRLIMSLMGLLMLSTANARIPDFPDFCDEQGFLYQTYRNDSNGNPIAGHEGEVRFWGVETRRDDFANKFKTLKVLKVPSVMTVHTDGKTITCRVTSICGTAFNGMPDLDEIFIPEGINYINPFALSGTKAKKIHIPSTVTKINLGSFNFFQSNWEKVFFSPKNPTYCDMDGVVYSKDKKQLMVCPVQHHGKIQIPKTVTEICDEAFEDVSKIDRITLPNGTVKIGESAFYKSSIKDITLPATVKEIGQNALNYCKQLKTIRCRAAEPPRVAEDNLWGLNLEELTVYIPKGSLEKYRQADWWKHIKNFVEE